MVNHEKLNDDEVTDYQGKFRQSYNLKLRDWTWGVESDENGIVKLACKDTKGAVRFNYKRG